MISSVAARDLRVHRLYVSNRKFVPCRGVANGENSRGWIRRGGSDARCSERLTHPFCNRQTRIGGARPDLVELVVVKKNLQSLSHAMSMLDSSP